MAGQGPRGWVRPPVSVRRRPHYRRVPIAWALYDHRLGQEPDAHIAADIGCSATAVYKRRSALGIDPFEPTETPLADVVARFGRRLTSMRIAPLFETPRSARRYLSEAEAAVPELVRLGATRTVRWLLLPKGMTSGDFDALPEGQKAWVEAQLEAAPGEGWIR